MKQTPNYNLNKPDYTDVADIKELNTNMDILDRIIKGISDGQFTVEEAKRLFSPIEHNHDDSYLGKTAKANDSELLDGLDSTAFLRSYMGNGTLANDLGVAQYLRWKNYGNGHTIFDASHGTTPSGRACDRNNAENNYYSANCPNLMGWNGHQTYGLGVDRARTAEQVQGFKFRNNNGQLEVLVGGVWLSVGGKQYTVTRYGTINNGQRFDYSGGSGVLRGINCNTAGGQIVIDGVSIPITEQTSVHYALRDSIYQNLEFKNSISIINNNTGGNTLKYLVQTEI